MTITIREAPASKDNEMMVLGCMLTNQTNLKSAAESLNDSDFYFTEHKLIFNTLKSAHKNNGVADIHLISEDLKEKGQLQSVGGVPYIVTLVQFAGTSAYIEEYIDDLKEHSRQRLLLSLSQKIERLTLNKEGNSSKIILEIQEEINRIENNKGSKEKIPIKFLNQFDNNFLLTNPPEKPMLLEFVNEQGIRTGFIPKGIVAMLVGAGGVGKTHLLAQLAISVSTGSPWLNTFTTTKHCGEKNRGSVFFGLGENQYDDIHRVLHKASQQLRKHQPSISEEDHLLEASKRIAPFSFCGQQAAFIENKKPSLYFRQLKTRLIETAPKEGWSLIILDPVSRLMGADAEVDNAAATQFIALLEELTIELPGNPTVLFAHHVSKAAIRENKNQNQTAARGASALTDGVRWQCNLFKNENGNITLSMEKTNFTAIPNPIQIKKNQNGYLEKVSHNAGEPYKEKLFG